MWNSTWNHVEFLCIRHTQASPRAHHECLEFHVSNKRIDVGVDMGINVEGVGSGLEYNKN